MQLMGEIQKVKAQKAKAQATRPQRVPVPSSEQQVSERIPPYPLNGLETQTSMDNLRSNMDNLRMSGGEQAMDYPQGRPTSQPQFIQDRYQQQQYEAQFASRPVPPSEMSPYAQSPIESSPTSRIPPGARVPVPPMPYNDQQTIPSGRPSSQYERYQPPGPDGYGQNAGFPQVSFWCEIYFTPVFENLWM